MARPRKDGTPSVKKEPKAVPNQPVFLLKQKHADIPKLEVSLKETTQARMMSYLDWAAGLSTLPYHELQAEFLEAAIEKLIIKDQAYKAHLAANRKAAAVEPA